jgi:DNA-binding IclR family transcriptional regulator
LSNENNENINNSTSNTIRAVDRALDVLLCFSVETPALTMTEISEKVGIHKSTVHRILATLEDKDFVRRDPDTGIYHLGFRLLKMANLSLEDVNIRHITLPFMRQLADEFHENVDLAILDKDEVIFIDTLESSQRVKLAVLPGQHLPAYKTASGKAILSFLNEEEIIRIFNKYNSLQSKEYETNLEKFLSDLQLTRKSGYAVDCENLEPGINAVAAPIIGLTRKPIASLSIVGPAYRIQSDLLNKMGSRLVDVTKAISKIILSVK